MTITLKVVVVDVVGVIVFHVAVIGMQLPVVAVVMDLEIAIIEIIEIFGIIGITEIIGTTEIEIGSEEGSQQVIANVTGKEIENENETEIEQVRNTRIVMVVIAVVKTTEKRTVVVLAVERIRAQVSDGRKKVDVHHHQQQNVEVIVIRRIGAIGKVPQPHPKRRKIIKV